MIVLKNKKNALRENVGRFSVSERIPTPYSVRSRRVDRLGIFGGRPLVGVLLGRRCAAQHS